MPSRMRLSCPNCKGDRFKTGGIDKLICLQCEKTLIYTPGKWRLADDETVRRLAERK